MISLLPNLIFLSFLSKQNRLSDGEDLHTQSAFDHRAPSPSIQVSNTINIVSDTDFLDELVKAEETALDLYPTRRFCLRSLRLLSPLPAAVGAQLFTSSRSVSENSPDLPYAHWHSRFSCLFCKGARTQCTAERAKSRFEAAESPGAGVFGA